CGELPYLIGNLTHQSSIRLRFYRCRIGKLELRNLLKYFCFKLEIVKAHSALLYFCPLGRWRSRSPQIAKCPRYFRRKLPWTSCSAPVPSPWAVTNARSVHS